jgi:cyclophilin family peptidyl-prolyl cis-trans isomerase
MAPNRSRVSKHKSPVNLWILGLIVIILVGVGVAAVLTNQAAAPPAPIAPTKVLLHTSAGDITIDLRTDKPITSTNFIKLVKEGKYDGTTFDRTIAGFMIQAGKVSGTVPTIKDEIGTNNHNINYTIAMAKTSSPNSASSEFFINTGDNSKIVYQDGTKFDATYTVFGTVISGQDVVDTIANAPATANPNIQGEISTPVNPVTIIHVSIVP